MNETDLERWLAVVGAAEVADAMASNVDRALFVVDENRDILLWNRAAEALLGFRAEDVVGHNCLKANRCEQCIAGCGIAEHGAVQGAALTLFAADGRRVHVRKHARAFFDSSGEFAGGVEVLIEDEQPLREPRPVGGLTSFWGLRSVDPAMHQLFETCRNVAQTDVSVVVRGESGTGKEGLARAVHAESTRANGPFVAVNCAALAASLMESELFGHVKGAFTGAVSDREGIFRQADTGTLFLDEVAELPLELQSKLLRVLEDGRVMPVGGTTAIPVDVRIVAATHQSLRARVAQKTFREDLMFRLRVVPLFIPPLRDRRGDVNMLLWHFIGERNRVGQRVVNRISPEAMRALLDYSWPGNVRELSNVVDYAFAVGRGPEMDIDELPPELRHEAPPSSSTTRPTARADEETRVRAALDEAGGHLGRAAELLGVSRATLWRRRKRYGL